MPPVSDPPYSGRSPRPRGLSFGTAADQYERYRSDYPQEVAEAVLGYAARPIRTALEVGGGTGKATRIFAERGITVTSLEPDPEMARVLVETTVGQSVEVVLRTFEGFDAGCRFDLVYSAAAWHWTDPLTRFTRAAQLLSPGGVLALFGSPTHIRDPALAAVAADVERRLLPAKTSASGHPWSSDDIVARDGFVDLRTQEFPRVLSITAADFVARLGTVSSYLILPEQQRGSVLRKIRSVLPARFEVDATVLLTMARRA